ncbi:hypothetical protein CJJ07_001441 [Candidozyma auris]|nr:hypothetical protein CJJ07_001441 [[Candida] auris]QEL62489.1 hypothetical protein CJJ09_004665 [[Candida] auris]
MSLQLSSEAPYSVKRRMQDDDNTFLPPPLSAYGIASLSDNRSEDDNNESGLKTVEIGENQALRASLRNSLSVHFKDSSSRDSYSNYNDTHNKSYGSQSFSANERFNTSAANNSSHNVSCNNYSGNLSGHSFSSTNMHTEENDDLMEGSNDPSAKSSHTSATTPGGSQATAALSRSSFTGFTKRSRFARRFASLGPPKRASEVSPSQKSGSSPEAERNGDPMILSKPEASQELMNAFKTPPSLHALHNKSGRASPKRVISNESTFFKSLEKLRNNSGDISRISPPLISSKNSPPPFVKPVINDAPSKAASPFQVFVDKQPSERPSSRGPSHRPWRQPLAKVSPSKINSEAEADVFRKPKIPKVSSIPNPTPPPPRSSFVTPQQPLPAKFPHYLVGNQNIDRAPDSSASGSSGMVEDGKRKKIIYVNNSQYEKLELIGRGGTSKVYKVRSLTSKKTYAIKKVAFDQFDESCVKGFKGEIDLLSKLRDQPRVVQLHDYAINDGTIYLTMECGELDLAHVLQQRQAMATALDLSFVRFHAIEVLKCVEAVHEAGIVHSDLKPANFLFVRGIMKIIDFGIANAVPDHTANIYRESQIGTPNYMAPEALVEVNHTLNMSRGSAANTWKVGKPSDIWSCGCIIYQMIYGRPPYASYAGQQRIMAIMNPQVQVHYPANGLGDVPVPKSAIELMKKCLVRNPHERWTVQQCLASDFLKPKAVSTGFIKDVVRSAVNYGYHRQSQGQVSEEVYDKLVDSIIHQIRDLNYA